MLLAAAAALALAAPPPPRLVVTYWPHNDRAAHSTWTLRCAPPGGTHPRPALACAELAAHPDVVLPVTRPCPLFIVRGAPQARIAGSFRGRSVDRLLRLGCDSGYLRSLHVLLAGR